MSNLKIMTYGRLGKEFEEFANSLDGIECTYFNKEDVEQEIGKFKIIAGLALPEGPGISHLKWVHAFSAGVDYWLTREDLSQDTLLTRTKGRMGIKIGEYCLTHLLYHLKDIDQSVQNQKRNKWQQLPQENLFDQNVLILGTGGIGEGIANVLKPLVKGVTGVSKSGNERKGFNKILSFNQLPDDLSSYNIVINAFPLTASTENLIDYQFFRRFTKAIYINVGRGGTTNITDLIKATDEKHIRSSILDVFTEEPLPEDSPLWQHKDMTITAHQSGVTDFEDVKMDFLKALKAYETGEKNDLVVERERGY